MMRPAPAQIARNESKYSPICKKTIKNTRTTRNLNKITV
jgi:hypothetical protein